MSSQENPYAAPSIFAPAFSPETEEDAGLWRKGSLLVMHKHATLPSRCVKSNAPTTRTLKRNLSWHHPAVFLALPLNILLYIILATVLSKRATIYIGLSERYLARRTRAIAIGWGMGLGSVVWFVAGLTYLDRGNAWAAWLFAASILAFFFGVLYGLIGSRMVTPTRITDEYVWLKGVHPDFLANLPIWPHHP